MSIPLYIPLLLELLDTQARDELGCDSLCSPNANAVPIHYALGKVQEPAGRAILKSAGSRKGRDRQRVLSVALTDQRSVKGVPKPGKVERTWSSWRSGSAAGRRKRATAIEERDGVSDDRDGLGG